jgi:hypothetical protein
MQALGKTYRELLAPIDGITEVPMEDLQVFAANLHFFKYALSVRVQMLNHLSGRQRSFIKLKFRYGMKSQCLS